MDNIKVDFLMHRYPILQNINFIDEIPCYAIEDVMAMKLNAIINRGAKKDFFDINYLLEYFTLAEMLSCYQLKYSPHDLSLVLRSLVYFNDADNEPDPILANGSFNFDMIKQHLKNAVSNYIKQKL